MIEVPAEAPVKLPVMDPIVATVVLPLIQVPPNVPSVNVIPVPEHKLPGPDMPAGAALIVTVAVAAQPVDSS